MSKIKNFLYRLLNKTENGKYLYTVKVSEIKIPKSFKQTRPRDKKMNRKWNYYRKYNKFESQIKLNRDFVLVDGYTSYIIAKTEGCKYVDIMFVD